jgi:hypothetical protein
VPSPGRLIDWLFPIPLRRLRLRKRTAWGCEELIVRNAENLRWAVLRGFDEVFRKTTLEFQERLDDAIRVTRGVIEIVMEQRRDQTFAIEPELERLAAAHASLISACREL